MSTHTYPGSSLRPASLIEDPIAAPQATPGEVTAPDWSFYSTVYDRLYRLGYHKRTDYSHARELCRYVTTHLKIASMLDVGAALGWSIEYFAARGIRACGVDVSETAVTRARRLGRDVRLGSATDLPFADRAFDLVLSTDCLEHMRPEDADRAVAELCRVSARYLALKINPRRDRNRWWRWVARTDLHLTLMPIEAWIKRFEAHGVRLHHLDRAREEFIMERH